MKHLSLAARYRPQTFADVAGQDTVKAVLSRAAAEDKVAAAYLLSGTRGVGKTTIARIFAKALNCEHAPGPEPCNQCAQCRRITQGSHVDVTEIDGASNNSVEDARALRETIGYAPMEGRYKVFIIDEAHMLSRNAFNALLKTLEEPPERVVFIFATTEVHKFPITIVSRCQHFVFRHLSEDALTAHLRHVLHQEAIHFDEGAIRLIARRAAGSVRDSMSLLDQALALGGDELTAHTVREVLGLAGQELFVQLFEALLARDCAAVAELTRSIARQGVDIGFFVRELSGHLRNCFLLRQGGRAMLPHLDLTDDEAAVWLELAPRFLPAHLHAAWQMTLDAQRGIVQNPEPAAALELMLLNLALLPQLLPLENLPAGMPAAPSAAADAASADVSGGARPRMPRQPEERPAAQPPVPPRQPVMPPRSTTRVPDAAPERRPGRAATEHGETDADSEPAPRTTARQKGDAPAASPAPSPRPAGPVLPAAPADTMPPAMRPSGQTVTERNSPTAAPPVPDVMPEDTAAEAAATQGAPAAEARPTAPLDWQAFCAFCAQRQEAGLSTPPLPVLRQMRAEWLPGRLRLFPSAAAFLRQAEKDRPLLMEALAAFGAGSPEVELIAPRPHRSGAELVEEFRKRPEMQACLSVLNATITHCTEA